MGRKILQEALGKMSFSLNDADFGKIQHTRELISITIEFEKDKVQFYRMLRPFIEEPDSLENLEEIIAEEQRHIDHLQQYVQKTLFLE